MLGKGRLNKCFDFRNLLGVSKALFFKNKQAETFHRGSSLSLNISSNTNHKKVKFNHVLTKNLISLTTQNRQTNSPNSKSYTILHSVWTYTANILCHKWKNKKAFMKTGQLWTLDLKWLKDMQISLEEKCNILYSDWGKRYFGMQVAQMWGNPNSIQFLKPVRQLFFNPKITAYKQLNMKWSNLTPLCYRTHCPHHW